MKEATSRGKFQEAEVMQDVRLNLPSTYLTQSPNLSLPDSTWPYPTRPNQDFRIEEFISLKARYKLKKKS